MKKKVIWTGCAIAVVAAIILSFVAGRWWNDRRRSNFVGRTVVYVYPWTTSSDVLDTLESRGAVRRPASLKRTFRSFGVEDALKPGRYQIEPSASSAYVARMLSHGWQSPGRLVLSGTMRDKGTIARKISSQLMLDSASMRSAIDDSLLLASYGFAPKDFFALVIPDTYEIYWTSTPAEVLDCLKKAYDSFWTPERDAKAAALGLDRLEVSTLASIVNGETNYEKEMPRIAGVYLNRLRTGMRLQADPTVAYCFGYSLNRILYSHLEVDSPYNTYKYAGLPPGPVNAPSKAALDAVLNAEKHNYFYFCASPDFDGSHRFAATLTEHNANARAFQRALTVRQASK